MTEAELLEQARLWVSNNSVILHRELGVVGRASKVWNWGEYEDANGRRVTKPVMQLDNGNAFVLREDEADLLVEVSLAEYEVYTSLMNEVRTLVTGALVAMGQRVKDPARLPIALAVLQAAISSQLRALRTGGA